MLAIVISRADSASEHVGEHLLDLADWTEHVDETRPDADGGGAVYRTDDAELREFDALHLETEDLATAFGAVTDGPERDPDLLVFASRHAGETGALLTAHHTGNFGPAEFGGEDGSLARACPHAHDRVLSALREHAPDEYDVGMEATHHGPSSVGVPSMFVELGSGDEQWQDSDGAGAVARAILDVRGVAPDAPVEASGRNANAADASGEAADGSGDASDGTRRHLVGFGGGHYAPRFERIARETDWAVGHVAADWALDDMGDPAEHRDVIRQAFAESAATRAVVEGDAPDGLEAVVSALGYRVVSETWVRETSGADDAGPVPLDLADALETALCPVDQGLRFGDRARGDDAATIGGGTEDATAVEWGDLTDVPLPDALLAEALAIDADAARAAVAAATLAFETVDNGTRPEGQAIVVDAADREQIVEDLVAVLRERYETVERDEAAVVAHEVAFDPERARTLGVPDGPKLGRLADGQPVEVDGQTIDPDVVHVDRERRFELPE